MKIINNSILRKYFLLFTLILFTSSWGKAVIMQPRIYFADSSWNEITNLTGHEDSLSTRKYELILEHGKNIPKGVYAFILSMNDVQYHTLVHIQ
ncbi:MAG: hypothetical protein HQK83_03070 [Fibrobacteria bacterium]|nr:hypothetical protein [Fibrobacteria bacterium]